MSVRGVDDGSSMHGEWLVSARGLFRRGTVDGQKLPPGWTTILPARVTSGQTWVSDPLEKHLTPWQHALGGWENVRVGAGTFRSIRVGLTCDLLNRRDGNIEGRMSVSMWLAPGIGVVKQELRMDAERLRQYGLVVMTDELTSFTPGEP